MKLLILLLAIPVCSFSQTAMDIINTYIEKTKEVKNITFTVYDETTYWKVSADVTIEKQQDSSIFGIAKIKFNGISIEDAGSKQISYCYNGQSFDFSNLKTHELTRLDSPTLKKLSRTGMMPYTLMAGSQYWERNPGKLLLERLTHAEKLDDTLIHKIPCYQIKIKSEVYTDRVETGKLTSESIWFIDKDRFLFLGSYSESDKRLFKIRSINDKLSDDFFSLSPVSEIKKITGLDPISEGLLKTGTKAPAWSLPSSGNRNINLNDLKGKVVLLDFWGTWCVPCLIAMPDIQAISERFKNEEVEVIGVSVEPEKKTDPIEFAKRKGFTYTILLNGEKITEAYKVFEFPSVYLIDKKGNIIHAERGIGRENFKEDLIKRIQAALKE